MSRITRIWLQQPIAFARVGKSAIPMTAFRWSEPDLRPKGTAKTLVVPAASYSVDESGALARDDDVTTTLFRDEHGIRPVCPFFELHGEWEGQRPDEPTNLTEKILADAGVALSDITWTLDHANHKAFSLTHSRGDRIEAHLSILGDDFRRHALEGQSPQAAQKPLIPPGQHIPMGALQAVRPSAAFPEIVVRFYAPVGDAYGPSDLHERLKNHTGVLALIGKLFKLNTRWDGFDLPEGRRILNPDAEWPHYRLLTWAQICRAVPRILARPRAFVSLCREVQLSELARFIIGPLADAGKLPPGLFASIVGNGAVLSSLGLVDDLGDGILTCTLAGVAQPAHARIVVGPPHFAPDRRPPVSIADTLTDRLGRADVRSPGWITEATWSEAEKETDDLLDRAFETVGLSNLDAWNEQLGAENASNAVYWQDVQPPANLPQSLWQGLNERSVVDLPLTQQGRWRHRRNAADEFFELLVWDKRHLFEDWIRTPEGDRALFYDKRMPALMRGSDRRPLHLTRRQLEALKKWMEYLRSRQRKGLQ